MQPIECHIDCEPAAFGVAHIPVAVPAALQGHELAFEVGATVEYPQGKGRMLRFRDGIVIRHDAQFRYPFGRALAVLGALGGSLVRWKPATVTLELPRDVAAEIPDDSPPSPLWRLGDAVSMEQFRPEALR